MTVDICITTEMKEMEGVCIIADLLAKSEQYDDSVGLCRPELT